MRALAVLFCVIAAPLEAQQPASPSPPAPPAAQKPESARGESVTPPPVAPAPPSPDQKRFLDGLRTATRGVAQLKDGVARVTRTQATHDSAAQRSAGRFLAGLCGSARAFMRRGRPRMSTTAYTDSAGLKARRLVVQMDSLIAFAPGCERDAGLMPRPTADALAKRMQTYDTAMRDFRMAIGLPVKEDSARTPRRP